MTGSEGRVAGEIALAAISHGTSSPLGQSAVASLVDAVALALGDVPVRGGFVDVQQPDVEATLDSLPQGTSTVVVPLLLSAGYHVHVDLTRTLASESRDCVLADALGPDRRLVDLLIARLLTLGLRASDRIVLACAGSSDDRAVEDCLEMGRMLGASLGAPVRVGFLSAAGPSVAEAVQQERLAYPCSRVIVSTYLLAPGYFADLAAASQADLVSPPLLTAHEPPDASIIEVVLERYRSGRLRLERTGASTDPGVPLGLA
ncbi:cobalamin biosynthesis protein CbiX [Salinibacterium sp. SYSU T00001]|uniref:sirohydrochlorin chelatase n=1 Tax=Homoserinimonas sedimenticola TaxID=2986805 RepID=UPI0022362257|nr:CbiX/SirB N-terminal domain-containing protein [Salinibacterium sedimenticola]MCW4384854.1 cobalamin biosynthesis protein CbiX [Salinibacterium sedimenticola]